MRLSELLVKTERQVAASAELASHQLLLRAGLAGDATPGTGR
jgi:prolyl-tRNA synthetase